VNERLAKLENRIGPPASLEPNPQMDLMLRLMDHRRQELDYQDREADRRGRLEAEAEPPEPLVLTLDEKREMLAGVPAWLSYLEAQRERANADLSDVIADAIETSRQSAARLETEIATTEGVDE
jgi:hypothetical protein